MAENHPIAKEYKIKTGEFADVSIGARGGKLRIFYSGMPNDQTFALSPVVPEGFHLDILKYVPTIYYRKESKQISVVGNSFTVTAVTPDEIILQYLK
ncbi:MAG: hypothetical protein QW594_03945 [Candidatus Woesearchaeota archaeon]